MIKTNTKAGAFLKTLSARQRNAAAGAGKGGRDAIAEMEEKARVKAQYTQDTQYAIAQ